jgi:hypothetical protein
MVARWVADVTAKSRKLQMEKARSMRGSTRGGCAMLAKRRGEVVQGSRKPFLRCSAQAIFRWILHQMRDFLEGWLHQNVGVQSVRGQGSNELNT